ncbi:EAL domain-containing protein [Marinomonas sp. IMCC 4694]|uniref:EAL domain-containing protein n=1 Tax=Marinomonas sp. IMCC 4694 TaxID=2605432 RepID=UPI0011E6AD7B|nr:EAL domain-containing protein [Marinomonas sp. IMCC 4694]TYL46709.1 EAL domain-containing protein [Marinomonas sp. IMCC 4694]
MMKTTLPHISFKQNILIVHVFLSLLVCLTFFTAGLYIYLLAEVESKTRSAHAVLSDQMNGIVKELKHVVDESAQTCEQADTIRLQRAVFFSPTFKEFGLFDEGFTVFCSSIGAIDITLYSSIIARITGSKERTTVSLMRSTTLSESTFFAFYQRPDGLGINGLAPPEILTNLLDPILLPEFFYALTVGKQILVSSRQGDDLNILAKRSVTLEDWAMTLDVSLPSGLYWQTLFSLLPFIVVCWLLLSIVFYASHHMFFYYRRSLRHCLKRAIKNGTLEVHFQPIVSLNTEVNHELEALVRWYSPLHGQVPALVIVDMVQRLGLIDDLTWMVIRKVGDLYRAYPQPLNNIHISVNVDRHSLLKESFATTLCDILQEYPELKGRLGLEVTETSVLTMIELPVMVSRFEGIKALGVGLSVDDFGTGYAGLDFLRRFPYDTLKLDQVFIAGLKEDPFTRQILTSVTKLAKELNMALVAEGVERKDQLDAVRALGVDKVQGYYFCRALPKEQVIAWLEKNIHHCP